MKENLKMFVLKCLYINQLLENGVRSFSLVHKRLNGPAKKCFYCTKTDTLNCAALWVFCRFRVNFFAKSFRNVFSSFPPFLILSASGGPLGGNPSYLKTASLSQWQLKRVTLLLLLHVLCLLRSSAAIMVVSDYVLMVAVYFTIKCKTSEVSEMILERW